MASSSRAGKIAAFTAFAIAVSVALWAASGAPAAQSGAAASAAPDARAVLADDLQRSSRQYAFQLAAERGAGRGEELYFTKCWMCHNQYTVASGTPAPLIKDLYRPPAGTNGDPATAAIDARVAAKIRNGGAGMPAYRHTLSDADVADLLSYFKSGRCCFEGNDPPPNPWYRGSRRPGGELQVRNNLRGGPTGVVRLRNGEVLEGIMVQLISAETAIRTTVYSSEEGRYEFPKLPAGSYTLRIARPMEFKPYRRESVRIDGANALPDIELESVTDAELLPPTIDIAGQLSGAEWLDSVPGTNREKRTFVKNCNWCHSYQLIFRARYDEQGWRQIIGRMTQYQGSTLINRNPAARFTDDEELLVKWLSRVRGPESKDTGFKPMPGPRGLATRVIVTEYELPRLWLATHDVAGDSKGQLWYTPHRSPHIGKVDPRTGVVQEYEVPDTPGAHPGTHWIQVMQDDTVWMSQNWAHKLFQFNPKTETFRYITPPSRPNDDGSARALNTPMGGNWIVHPDGHIWKARDKMVVKVSPETGKYVATYPIKNFGGTYGSAISHDGRYFAGGGWPGDWSLIFDMQTGEVIEAKTRMPNQGPGRGHFDPFGNGWFGGKGGALVRIDARTRRVKEFFAPEPYASFYEANPDKNGEVWAGTVQSGRYVRFDPKTERWIVYVLPEPYSHNRESWIDNSTDPVSLWYVDHNSYLVHIQPLE